MKKINKVYIEFKEEEKTSPLEIKDCTKFSLSAEAQMMIFGFTTDDGQQVEKHIRLDCIKYMNVYE